MTTITTRAGKGSPLLNSEVDANFTNLNDDKVETSGDSMTGNLSFGDNDKAVFGAGSDLQIFSEGSGGNSFISEEGSGTLFIQGTDLRFRSGQTPKENFITAIADGAVTLYHNNSQKLATTSTGIDVTGSITTDGLTSVGGFISIGADGAGDDFRFYGDTSGRYMEWVSSADSLLFRDGAKALFGNGSDLQIYHDPNHSIINESGTGSLKIQGDNIRLQKTDGSENMITAVNDGAVTLFYDNAAKIATTSTGIDVTGTVTADDVIADGSLPEIYLKHSGTELGGLRADSLSKLELKTTGSYPVRIQTNNVNVANFAVGGDISFYEDTGTTAKFFWDASAESLGIGTSSPSRKLHVNASGVTALFGNTESNNSIELTRTTSSASYVSLAANSSTAGIVAGPTFTFSTANSGGGAVNERMRIDSSGRVGIGTSSPDAALSLASGTADSNGIKMQASGWPHYVRSGINGTTGSQFIQSTNWNANTNTVDSASHATTALILDTSSGSIQLRTATTNTVPTEAMRIDSSGNVGIGTSSPAELLHVHEDSTGVARMRLSNTEGYLEIGTNNQVSNLDSETHTFRNEAGSTEYMRIDSSGQVGIGTSSPAAPLDVAYADNANIFRASYASSEDNFFLELDSAILTGGVVGYQFHLKNNGTSYNNMLTFDRGNVGIGTSSPAKALHVVSTGETARFESTNATSTIVIKDDLATNQIKSVNGKLSIAADTAGNVSNSRIDFTVDNSEAMRIDSSGNVGIGTSSPNVLGHFYKGSSGRTWTPDGADVLAIENNDSIVLDIRTPSSNQGLILFSDADARGRGLVGYVHSSDHMYFSTAGTERMRIDSSGNVGIGATSMAQKLVITNNGTSVYADQGFTNSSSTSSMFIGVGGSAVSNTNLRNNAYVLAGNSGSNLVLGTDATERMRIDSSGNVGINTTSPAATLHTVANSGTTALLTVGASGNNIASFYTSGSSQVMTLDSSGNLLVGTTSSVGVGSAKLEILGGASGGRCINTKVTVDTSANHLTFHNGNGQVGFISTAGTTTTYNTSSDQRLKDNIVDAPSASDDIDAIQVRSFDWKADGSHQKYGMVAQELQSVAPEAVSQGETEEDMMGVDYSKLVPMMMKEIQSLRARVAQLEGVN